MRTHSPEVITGKEFAWILSRTLEWKRRTRPHDEQRDLFCSIDNRDVKPGATNADNSADFAKGMLLPWTKDFLLYDPRPDLNRVSCPVFSLIGEKDMQVEAERNNTAISKARKEGGNQQVTVVNPGGLNHLLQTAPTGSPAEYLEIMESMD